ncbi:MAG: hypothetical protein COT74_09900 [Bdellovibrionales bacterium CG10_big_fil_rev_8_21_14_0_10_45_34]|nr:MAG: hypothetical protein COT74_09900 [Bdellovibrionales bacterium CG10_big_fil_rev_8_21_14_0_10_45_34]
MKLRSFVLPLIVVAFLPQLLIAQSGLEGRIGELIADLVRLMNVVIIGFIAWAGLLIAKGESSGLTRLVYGVIGLVVVNAAQMIIDYFM